MGKVPQSSSMGALRSEVGPGITQDLGSVTTQQLIRENFWLRELLESKLTAIETRILASDKAVQLLQAFADRTPTTNDVQHDVEALREVVMEKFNGIKTQIVERDVATEKASKDVKSAVDAAFAAAKEAVGEQNKSNALSITKSETGFTKQIDGISDLIKTNAKAVDDKINDIKERITIIESKTNGINVGVASQRQDGRDMRLEHQQNWGYVFGGVGIAVGLVSLVLVLAKIVT